MTFPEQIQKALSRPLSRWVRFLRDVAIDLVLIVFARWAASAVFELAVHDQAFLSGRELLSGSTLGIVAVALLFWRGIYSINYRYFGLRDFLNIAFAGMVSGVGLIGVERFSSGIIPRGGEYVQAFLFGFFVVSFLSSV